MTDRLLYSVFAFFLITGALGVGCAPKQVAKKKVYTWRFNNCTKNGDHEVCECNTAHEELNATTGKPVMICE